MKPFGIRRARPEETDALSEIAFTSKQFWRYPAEWMNIWRSVLSLKIKVGALAGFPHGPAAKNAGRLSLFAQL
jgi:hypothetical protein